MVRRLVRALRHPLRLALALVAVAAATAPMGSPLVLASALLGATLGIVLGEVLGRTRLRAVPVATSLLGAGAAAVALSWLIAVPRPLPALLGPEIALWLSTATLAMALAATPFALLRALAVRASALAVVELGTITGLFILLVATHRDGAISRPLWLSDLTWSLGVDPGRALIAMGVALALALIILRLLDADRRVPTVGLAWIPALAVGGLLLALWIGQPDEPLPERLLELQEGGDEVAEGEDERDQLAMGGSADGDAERDSDGASGQRPSGGASQGGGAAEQLQGDQGQTGGQDAGGGASQGGQGEGESQQQQGEGGSGGDRQAEAQPDGGGDASDPADGGGTEAAPDPLEERDPGGADSPMAVVLLEDDHNPIAGYWYLRQQVFSDYKGIRMLPATLADADRDALRAYPVAEEAVPDAPGVDGRQIVHGSVSLLVEHDTPFALESPAVLAPRGNPHPARFVRSYRFVSHALATPHEELIGREVGDPDWSPELWEHYLRAPADPRYAELAQSWVDELPDHVRDDPVARAIIIAHHLGASMKYTLTARYPDSEDPTAAFLFGPRIGYCVHSAHAAAYLWRSVGVPSRVATGYAISEDERRGSVLLVRGSQAHAWPELYIAGLGWVPLDIAPSEDLDQSQGAPPNEEEIALLGDMAREPPPPELQTRTDLSWIWRPLGIGLLTLATVGLSALLLLHYAAKAWRRARPLLPGAHTPRTAYRAALDRLAEVGLSREPGETREAFARRVAGVAPSFSDLTALHLRAALGPAADEPASLRGALARVRVDLRENRPWWLRAIGLLDPTSIYRAR